MNPTLSQRERIERQIAGHEALRQNDRFRIRLLSLEERSRLIDSACEDVAAILDGRRSSGFPPYVPSDWPESTWKLLREYAPNGRARLTNCSSIEGGG